MHEYAFDVKMNVVMRVQASSEKRARFLVAGVQAEDLDIRVLQDSVFITEGSVDCIEGLFEVDKTNVELSARKVNWTKGDELAAIKEGWLLTNDSAEKYYIARVDDPSAWTDKDGKCLLKYRKPKFKWDEDAQAFVRASRSAHARKALKLIGKPIYKGVKHGKKKAS